MHRALWVEADPEELASLQRFRRDAFSLTGHINDRRWAASSLLAVAVRGVFATAMAGTCKSHPDLPATPFDLEATVAAVPAPEAEVCRLFEPLG